MMEPIKPMTMWHGRYGVHPTRVEDTDKAVAVIDRADFDALVRELDGERRNHNHYGQLWLDVCRKRDAATARADTASAKLAQAEALLREAADLMFDRDLFPVCNDAAPLRWRERVAPIIDAGDAPTPDDRRGVDGEAIEAQGGLPLPRADEP